MSIVNWAMLSVLLAATIWVIDRLELIRLIKSGYKRLLHGSRHPIRFKWSDIPHGRVHECHQAGGAIPSRCWHPTAHMKADKCWQMSTSVGGIFNRGWRRSAQDPQYANIDTNGFAFGSSYLCTDARTILAFIMMTVGPRRDSAWQPGSLWFDTTQVTMETLAGNTVAHIQGSFQPNTQTLTKHELSCMLLGWPPWYREVFVTEFGVKVSFPIRDELDIPRGGWIVAVGLADQAKHSPLAIYRCPNEPSEPGFRQNGGTFRKAIVRCRDRICKNIQPHFLLQGDVADAIEALTYLIENATGSGVSSALLAPRSHFTPLSASSCKFICGLFNGYDPLTETEIAQLRPILRSAMAAAVQGAFEVVQYLKDSGVELKIPPELQPFDREIWLRDCRTRLPLK